MTQASEALGAFAALRFDHARIRPDGGRLDVRAEARGRAALEAMRTWPAYAPTPLLSLAPLARALGVGAVLYKDESGRFGVGSFKPMGAAYALGREVGRALGLPADAPFSALRDAVRSSGAPFTACCASDGNHGRALAWAAQALGLPCVVFLHSGVEPIRAQAIAEFGADVRRVVGNYDNSIAHAQAMAEAEGWRVISDTAYPGASQAPDDVLSAYLGMMAEVQAQLGSLRPDLCVAQAGVGGLAAAMAAHFTTAFPDVPPGTLFVEPLAAACILASARAGRRAVVRGDLKTAMGGLSCGEPSTLAWPIIAGCGGEAIAIEDAAARLCAGRLASGDWSDAPVTAGESGAAGLAGLVCAALDPALRAGLGLSRSSVVLTVGTEGRPRLQGGRVNFQAGDRSPAVA